MGTLAPPYDIRLWLYPGVNPSLTATDWGIPLDVTAYLRQPGSDGGSAITYTEGRQDEASQVDAGSLTLTLDNRTGLFSTRNVTSSLYGKLKRNTPIALLTRTGYDTFTRTVGVGGGTSDSGQLWSAGSLYSVNGSQLLCTTTATNQFSVAALADSGAADYDMTFTVVAGNAAATGAAFVAGGLEQQDGSNYLMYKLLFNPGAAAQVQFQRQGTAGGAVSSTAISVGSWAPNDVWVIRCQRTGNDVRMKAWLNSGSEPPAWSTTWTEQYVKVSTLGVFGWRQSGNTNTGNWVFAFDNITMLGFEVIGNVVAWPTRWDKSGNNSWAPISAAGVLRRLQQGKGPIRSPLTRQLGRYNPTGWWPLEDDAGASSFANNYALGQPATFSGVTPGGDNSLPGSGPAATLTAVSGKITGKATARHFVDGFAGMIFTKFPGSLPSTKTRVCSWSTTGAAARYDFSISTTSTYIDVYDADGNVLSTSSNLFGATADPANAWIAWSLKTQISGSNTAWTFTYHPVTEVNFYTVTGSFASTVVAQCTGFTAGSTNLPTGTAFSQAWIGPNTLPFTTNSFALVANAYLGELAGDRLTRLCYEESIPFKLELGTTDPVGYQPQSNILQALRSASDADGGILYESGTGLGYRPRSTRYQQTVDLALSVAAGQIDDPPEPTDDDQRYRNKWTVTNDGGSYAIAQDANEIAAQGLYEDSVTLTLADDSYALNHAGWRLYLGTWPDLRWPGISINLARNPSLIPLWRRLRYGARMTVATGRTQVAGADPDVIIEGFTATLWNYGWQVALNCSSAKPFDITTLDDNLTRLDADNSTVNTAVNATATSLVVNNNSDTGNNWVPTSLYPAEVPFTITVLGEDMTVTNVGDPSGNVQTLTVTRNVNGGGKAHAIGESVRLKSPMILAL